VRAGRLRGLLAMGDDGLMAGDFELPDAATLAYTLSEAVADQEGDEKADEYLARFVDEILMLEPSVRGHLVDVVLDDLIEEVCRREDPEHAFAAVELIRAIRTAWANECG